MKIYIFVSSREYAFNMFVLRLGYSANFWTDTTILHASRCLACTATTPMNTLLETQYNYEKMIHLREGKMVLQTTTAPMLEQTV